jgi:ribosomal protein S8E
VSNPFDQFDGKGGNPFDRFDKSAPAKKPSMGGDFMRPIKEAGGRLVEGVKADYARSQRIVRGEENPNPLSLGPGPRAAGNALAVPLAVAQGAVEATVSRPAARAAIGAGLPVYERRNALSIPKQAPNRVYGQEAEDIVAGDVNLALSGARSGPVRAARPLPPPRPAATPVERAGVRARLDPAAMRARAAEMRQAGVEPTLTDVAGERGRRMIRAVGVRGEEAGEELTRRAAQATADVKPASMSATRRLNNDPRTANQYADDMEAARTAAARQNYGAFDHEPVEVPEAVIDMLSDGPGRAIIARARREAAENQEWPRLAELDRLAQHQPGDPIPRITAGTLDKLSGAARNRGAAFAARPGGGNMARGALGRRDQIDATMDGVQELQPARQTFANQSRAIEVARGDNYLDPLTTDPTDYAAWLQQLPAEARQANQIAIRQQILDKLGKQRENSFGALDDLTSAQYSRANLRSVFGQQEADAYLAQIAARVQQSRNAQFVQPNAGSRTAVLENDVGNAAQQTVGAVRQGLSGDVIGLAARAVDAWRRRGFTPQQAEELARIATDPTQTDAAINAIAARLAPQPRAQFLTLRRAARALPGVSRPAAAANALALTEDRRNALAAR